MDLQNLSEDVLPGILGVHMLVLRIRPRID